MELVVALVKEDVIPQGDAESVMFALEGVLELEKKGWKFTPPPPAIVDNSDPT